MSEQILGGIDDAVGDATESQPEEGKCNDQGCWCNIGFDEVEHDRTGGPIPIQCYCGHSCACDDTINTPLQEQVEQVEEALDKALSVIEAFVKLEFELRDDVYKAQVEAQDWCNRYNSLDGAHRNTVDINNSLARRVTELEDEARDWQNKFLLENRVADGRIPIIKELEAAYDLRGTRMLEQRAEIDSLNACIQSGDVFVEALELQRDALLTRIQELTKENTDLEVGLEQAKWFYGSETADRRSAKLSHERAERLWQRQNKIEEYVHDVCRGKYDETV
jgi:chromosome segregation ATPase